MGPVWTTSEERALGQSWRVAHVATIQPTVRFLLLPQLCYLRDEGYDVTAISAPGPYTRDVESEGIRFIPWPHATRAWHPTADVRALGELLAILRRERFHVLHTHTPKPGILGRIGARAAGIPLVVNTVHGLYVTRDDPLRRRLPVLAIEWLAARFSDVELYQSEEDLAWARHLKLARSGRTVRLGNGTDLSRFDPVAISPARLRALRRELGIPEGTLVIGTVGRLVAEKGYRELLAAFRDVQSDFPEVRLLAIGPREPDKPDGIRDDEVAAAGDRVIFAGPRVDVPDLLALMDVFVLASWREGVPRSAIEAAAMARPLILSDVRGCREVVRDGIEGVLIPPRDSKRLAETLTQLLGDSKLRTRLGVAARARAINRFDEQTVFHVIAETYERLLTRRHGRGGRLVGRKRSVIG
jgi:glycosyltransferase involved in cell wall biosynthesis